MILLNPANRTHSQPDARSEEVMRKTIAFFEAKGKERIKADDHARVWYPDFLDFVREERDLRDAADARPPTASDEDARWDTWRICEFAEILGFYGLPYWYTWQVTVLGLGPIWMSPNEEAKRRAAAALEDGGIFAFGLSEQHHGADLYSSDMELDAAGRRDLRRARREVLHRQRQQGRDGLDVRQAHRHRRVDVSSPPTPSTRTTSSSRTSSRARTTSPSTRSTTTRSPRPTSLTRRRRLGRGAQHGQHRQVQPRLGVDRHLHARALRGDHARHQPPPLRHVGDRLPARASGCSPTPTRASSR